MLTTRLNVDRLRVEVYPNRPMLGAAAAERVAGWMRAALGNQDRITMVFAAAPSQNEFLAALAALPNLAWQRVVALHMDEYIGLALADSQSFGYFLRERLFDRVRPGAVYYLNGMAEPAQESHRYAELLRQHPIDIVCAGIGENGHLAFNDPPVADFDDPHLVKVVSLERSCREQQVHDGCFARLEDVPTHALTLTIPALMQSRYLACIVPGPTKTQAVAETLRGPISPACPASILRRHTDAVLMLDPQAAAAL